MTEKEKLLSYLESLLEDCRDGYNRSDDWGPHEWSAMAEITGMAIEYIKDN